jgi:hypothetical protein
MAIIFRDRLSRRSSQTTQLLAATIYDGEMTEMKIGTFCAARGRIGLSRALRGSLLAGWRNAQLEAVLNIRGWKAIETESP